MATERLLYFGRDETEAARCMRALRRAGFAASRTHDVGDAVAACQLADIAVVLYDLRASERGAHDLINRLNGAGATVIGIVDEARGRVPGRLGAWDYVLYRARHCRTDLPAVIHRAFEFRRLQADGEAARRTIASLAHGNGMGPPPWLTDSVVAAISHEIKNPIAALLGYSQMLAEPGAFDAPVTEIARRLEANTQTVLALVSDLLDALRAESGSLSLSRAASDFNLLAASAVHRAAVGAARRGRRIVFRPAALLPAVVVDQARMARVLDELLGVALADASTDGVVRVTTAVQGSAIILRLAVSGTLEQGRARQVNGAAGVARLALARPVVEAHGGALTVRPGPDFVVSLRLPVTVQRLAVGQ